MICSFRWRLVRPKQVGRSQTVVLRGEHKSHLAGPSSRTSLTRPADSLSPSRLRSKSLGSRHQVRRRAKSIESTRSLPPGVNTLGRPQQRAVRLFTTLLRLYNRDSPLGLIAADPSNDGFSIRRYYRRCAGFNGPSCSRTPEFGSFDGAESTMFGPETQGILWTGDDGRWAELGLLGAGVWLGDGQGLDFMATNRSIGLQPL